MILNKMNLPIFVVNDNNDLEAFVNYWSKFYTYPLEKLYNGTISKRQFNENDLQNLFIWKNGMNLSSGKQSSVEKNIKPKLSLINEFKRQQNFLLADFLDTFNGLSAVWKIFLLHFLVLTFLVAYSSTCRFYMTLREISALLLYSLNLFLKLTILVVFLLYQ